MHDYLPQRIPYIIVISLDHKTIINIYLVGHPSRDDWTELKTIHINKLSIQNRVDDKTGSVDIANAFPVNMRIKTSVRNVCQHNYFCIQHCHFVNSTQISDVIKRLLFGKADGIDNLYSRQF